MINVNIQPGDFFLVDSNKTAPKIIKFLMTAPTCWHHLWRKIIGTQEFVRFYHAGLFLDKDTIIEQQSKVQIKSSEKLLNTANSLLIFRKKYLTESDRVRLCTIAKESLGQWYGVMSCIGKTLTWITGIKFFCRYVRIPTTEICINRVCDWYKRGIWEEFDSKTHTELTTHSVYKYIMRNPELFEIVYSGIPRNDFTTY